MTSDFTVSDKHNVLERREVPGEPFPRIYLDNHVHLRFDRQDAGVLIRRVKQHTKGSAKGAVEVTGRRYVKNINNHKQIQAAVDALLP